MCVDNVFHFIKLYTTSHTCVWHYLKCNCLWTLIHPKNKTLNCYQPWLLYEYRKLIIYISMFLVFLHSSWIIARQFSLEKWMLFNFKSDEKKNLGWTNKNVIGGFFFNNVFLNCLPCFVQSPLCCCMKLALCIYHHVCYVWFQCENWP